MWLFCKWVTWFYNYFPSSSRITSSYREALWMPKIMDTVVTPEHLWRIKDALMKKCLLKGHLCTSTFMYISASLIECLAQSRYSKNVEQIILNLHPLSEGALLLPLLFTYTLKEMTYKTPHWRHLQSWQIDFFLDSRSGSFEIQIFLSVEGPEWLYRHPDAFKFDLDFQVFHIWTSAFDFVLLLALSRVVPGWIQVVDIHVPLATHLQGFLDPGHEYILPVIKRKCTTRTYLYGKFCTRCWEHREGLFLSLASLG